MALFLLHLWVFPVYPRIEGGGNSEEEGVHMLKKNTALCAHSFFDGLAKVKLGFWARHLPKIMRISDTPPLLVSPDMLNQHAINQSKNNF